MCQTVSEGLLRRSDIAASSIRASHENFRTPARSSCSYLTDSSAKGLWRHRSHVARVVPTLKTVCCQVITHVPKQDDHVRLNSCNAEQQFSSPDRWMEDCVCDIVRNINEAPFLHMHFDSKDSSAAATSQRLRVEDGNFRMEKKWEDLKDCISKASPDGVILVHHLDESSMRGCCLRDGLSARVEEQRVGEEKTGECCKSTNLWGVLLLGKSLARSACYILKTTSVPSSYGLCTQFCLTKAKCFGPSWHEQMQNSWLLNTENSDCISDEGI